ncbi:hypothetical protein T02_493, partial [Trichinella nativa]
INLNFGECLCYCCASVHQPYALSSGNACSVTSRMHFVRIDDHFSAAFLYFRQTMNVTANTQIKATIGIADGHKAN